MSFDSMVTEARKGCCDDTRKPCTYHEGYQDALNLASEPLWWLDEYQKAVITLKDGRTYVLAPDWEQLPPPGGIPIT